MKILRRDSVHPTRKRLWQAGVAIGLVVLIVLSVAAISRNANGSHRLSLGEDFLPVYAAGVLIRDGQAHELYAMEPLAKVERAVVARADLDPLPHYGPFLNPPFFAAAYVPFAAFPYRQSLAIWFVLNLLLTCGSCLLLCRMMPGESDAEPFSQDARTPFSRHEPGLASGPAKRGEMARWGLVPFLLAVAFPFWEAMYHQQNSFLSLFLLCLIVTVWRAPVSRDVSAFFSGLIAGFLFYKPQLALAVTAILVITRGGWVLAGLAMTGASLSIFTLFKMPGTLEAFVHALPPTIHWMRTALPYNWGRQVTPQSFWRLLLQGRVTGETNIAARLLSLATASAFALSLAAAAVRFLIRQKKSPASLDQLISATILSIPLIMPYYMDYDLILFAIPAVLQSVDWIRAPGTQSRADYLLLTAWIALYLEFYLNPGLANHFRLNLAVPLLGLLAGLSIYRCLRGQVVTEPRGRYDAPELAVAA